MALFYFGKFLVYHIYKCTVVALVITLCKLFEFWENHVLKKISFKTLALQSNKHTCVSIIPLFSAMIMPIGLK